MINDKERGNKRMIFQRILDALNEDLRNTYHSTDKKDEIGEKIDRNKKVSIINPTSTRTITKGEQGRNRFGQFERRSYTESPKTEVGDTTASHDKKDYATTYQMPSTVVGSVKYDPKTEVASVTYKDGGKTYDYRVNPEEMKEFMDAPSKGQFLAENWNHNPHFNIFNRGKK